MSPFREVPAELLSLTDVLLVNRSEAGQLLRDDSSAENWQAAARRFADLGLDRVIVTLGADGSVVLDATTEHPDRVSTVEGIRVDVVDTTGCGDAFTGAVAHRLAAGDSLVDAARFAGRVSAMAATGAGAQSSYTRFAALADIAHPRL